MAPFFLCLTAVGLRRELAKRDDFGSDRDMEQPDNSLELAAHEKGYLRIAGVDEVGPGAAGRSGHGGGRGPGPGAVCRPG